MTSLNFDDQDGILRTISDAPPTHYTVKVQSISLLTKHNLEKYESGDFEAGVYKCRKLVFYPNGNKNRNVKEHISLYLVMSGATAPHISSEVYAVFRLFILDQNSGNYFVLQEPKERRFHRMKLDWGFDQFLSHKAFTQASNGFLIDDTCVLGAEVFVSKERSKGKGECLSLVSKGKGECLSLVSKGKGECLSLVKDPIMYKNTWRIDNVSKLDAESYDSKTFIAGDQKWKMQLYPKGKGNGVGTHLAFFLALAEPKSLHPGCQIYAEFILRILDQKYGQYHISSKANHWFSVSNSMKGWMRFTTLGSFNQAHIVLNDTCIVEANVTIHGITDVL